MKKQTTSRASLAGRLTAYSVMAGAALALMPTVSGKMVATDRSASSAATVSTICEMLPQSQMVQSQKLRHKRHAKMRNDNMRVMDSSSCSSTSSTTGGE